MTIAEDGDKKLELFGDARFRYEADANQREGKDDRNRDRARLRLRLGLKYEANEMVEMGVRLATNSDEIHSTHQTLAILDGGAAESSFGIDRGYLKIKLSPVWLWAGKNENVVWDPVEATWDEDFNPEGLGIGATFGDDVQFWVNAGYYILNETMWDNVDDTMIPYQLGVALKGDFGIKAAVGGYLVSEKDETNPDALSVPGGGAHYIHGIAEVSAKSLPLSPKLGVVYVTSDVDTAKYIGTGSEDADTNSLVVYVKGKAGVVKFEASYWDVGYAGATALGDLVQDNFPYTNNFTGFNVRVGATLLDHVYVDLRYYNQEVKNATIAPEHSGDAQLGAGNKRDRIQINVNVKF
jgi:hypothetical protein